jgi:hypothetical protein
MLAVQPGRGCCGDKEPAGGRQHQAGQTLHYADNPLTGPTLGLTGGLG